MVSISRNAVPMRYSAILTCDAADARAEKAVRSRSHDRTEIGGKGEQGPRYRPGGAITQPGATASAWSNGRTTRPSPKTSEPE